MRVWCVVFTMSEWCVCQVEHSRLSLHRVAKDGVCPCHHLEALGCVFSVFFARFIRVVSAISNTMRVCAHVCDFGKTERGLVVVARACAHVCAVVVVAVMAGVRCGARTYFMLAILYALLIATESPLWSTLRRS